MEKVIIDLDSELLIKLDYAARERQISVSEYLADIIKWYAVRRDSEQQILADRLLQVCLERGTLSTQDVAIYVRHAEGELIADIASDFGVSPQAIETVLRTFGRL